MSKQEYPEKDNWTDRADTTLAHNRGSQGDAQLKAEGRTLPTGLPRTRRPSGEVERATAPNRAEKATAKPQMESLDDLTVKDLKARASDAGVVGYSSMLKAELIEALQNASGNA